MLCNFNDRFSKRKKTILHFHVQLPSWLRQTFFSHVYYMKNIKYETYTHFYSSSRSRLKVKSISLFCK